jgi:DNA-binding transcriptional MocR family regulator
MLDTFYARLRRCGDVACTGRPFTEHSSFPVLTVDTADRRPPWQQVAGIIRETTGSGRLAPGEQIPSVHELAARHGIRTVTLQHALTALADERLISVRQGAARSSRACQERHHGVAAAPQGLGMAARGPGASRTGAGRWRRKRSATSTRSCPARSPQRPGGSGPTATRQTQRSC